MEIKKIKKNILLKNGLIYDPYSNKKIKSMIYIKNGFIERIGNISVSENMEVVDCSGMIISPGFIDIHSHFREPGREDKETLETGSKAAFSGGYTKVCVMPNTNPTLDTPENIRYVIDKSKSLPIKIFPIGAITFGQEGKEITEIGEMVSSGAVAISDDGIPVQNGQVLRYALEYSQRYGIPVINHAEDIFLRNEGAMNEGVVSTRLGLPGNPDISESAMVYRDLEIAAYCNGRIHIPHVSCKKSVDVIRRFKRNGVNVTAEVTPHHIGLSENHLLNYDTNAKVAPPLRTDMDREALIDGLIDGTIDCIASDHAPHTIEEKEQDFMHSPCGMIGLESAFGLTHTVLSRYKISTEKIIQFFTKGPALVMGWDIIPFKLNDIADIVIIDPKKKWQFKQSDIKSKSKNSPMVGMEFKGKVVGVISSNYSFGKILD
tara:strand:- start:7 stop:1302 length:1296 start_codon:yes stop_codon:yes gene_type:complete